MNDLPGGVTSAVQLHTLSVDLAASLTNTTTNPSPSTPRSWHAVTFPTYAAVRRTMTDRSPSSTQMAPESAVKSLPLRSLPSVPSNDRILSSTEARASSWRSIDRPYQNQRSLRPRPRSTRHHSSADGALPRPKPTRPRPSPSSSFTSTPSMSMNHPPIRRRFADREDTPTSEDTSVVRAANSMPARAFSSKATRWENSKRTVDSSTNATVPITRNVRPCSLSHLGAANASAGVGRVPRSAGGDGEDCPAANAFVAERQVRTEGPQIFRRVELVRPVASADRDDSRADTRSFTDTSFRRAGHRSPPRILQAPIPVKVKASPTSSGIVTSPASSASSSRESSIGCGRLGAKTGGVTGVMPTVGDLIGDDEAPPLGLAGTLGKRGRLTNRLVQRHFVLEGALLSNYRTREDVKPSWQKNIQGAHVIAKERSHQIIVAIGKKRVILYASSGEDTRDWADALGRAAYGGADADPRACRFGADVDVDVSASSTGDRSWAARLHSSKNGTERHVGTEWGSYNLGMDRKQDDHLRRRQSELRMRHHVESGFSKNRISSTGLATPNDRIGSQPVHVGSV